MVQLRGWLPARMTLPQVGTEGCLICSIGTSVSLCPQFESLHPNSFVDGKGQCSLFYNYFLQKLGRYSGTGRKARMMVAGMTVKGGGERTRRANLTDHNLLNL